ncbi:helix-turn-helix domain-containing protein [Paraconexibacter sp. AEG42_29]|uniref:TetR/AcrR family transcriptional regulator n=1 Tax=Paraconexibacter sp. AEG42_29 TaxID=2997339 RepID=UPI00339D9C55
MDTLTEELAAHAHGRVPRALRERQLLALGAELFAERGYAGASMDELATRAGVSKPVIYDLLGSKEELFRRCADLAAQDLHERVASAVAAAAPVADATAAEAQLRAGSLAFFRFAAEHRRSWSVLFAGDSTFTAEAESIRHRQTALVEALLTGAALEQGGAIDARQVAATAQALNGAFESLANWAAAQTDVTPETLTEWFVALTLPGLQLLARSASAGPGSARR